MTVGAVVGVGVAYQNLNVMNVTKIVSFWFLVPIIAFIMAWVGGRFIRWLERKDSRWKGSKPGAWKNILTLLVILTGFFEAFSAGMNNVANAVGPLVGAGLMDAQSGIFWAVCLSARGAILLGGRVMGDEWQEDHESFPLARRLHIGNWRLACNYRFLAGHPGAAHASYDNSNSWDRHGRSRIQNLAKRRHRKNYESVDRSSACFAGRVIFLSEKHSSSRIRLFISSCLFLYSYQRSA